MYFGRAYESVRQWRGRAPCAAASQEKPAGQGVTHEESVAKGEDLNGLSSCP